MWQQLSGDEAVQGQLPAGPQQLGMVAWRDTTVEDLVAIVQSLPHREPVVPAVMHGCALHLMRPLVLHAITCHPSMCSNYIFIPDVRTMAAPHSAEFTDNLRHLLRSLIPMPV